MKEAEAPTAKGEKGKREGENELHPAHCAHRLFPALFFSAPLRARRGTRRPPTMEQRRLLEGSPVALEDARKSVRCFQLYIACNAQGRLSAAARSFSSLYRFSASRGSVSRWDKCPPGLPCVHTHRHTQAHTTHTHTKDRSPPSFPTLPPCLCFHIARALCSCTMPTPRGRKPHTDRARASGERKDCFACLLRRCFQRLFSSLCQRLLSLPSLDRQSESPCAATTSRPYAAAASF